MLLHCINIHYTNLDTRRPYHGSIYYCVSCSKGEKVIAFMADCSLSECSSGWEKHRFMFPGCLSADADYLASLLKLRMLIRYVPTLLVVAYSICRNANIPDMRPLFCLLTVLVFLFLGTDVYFRRCVEYPFLDLRKTIA